MTESTDDRDVLGPHAMRLSWPTRFFFGALAILGCISVGISFASNRSDRAQERSDEVAACARQLRAPIDSTDADLGRATTEQTVLFFSGLVAVVQDDEATVQELIAQEPAVRAKVSKAQAAKDDAVAAYERAAKLPVDEFLEECRGG